MIRSDKIDPRAVDHALDGPLPGQSLTNSPDQPYPWEQPPEFTGAKQLTEKIFFDLLKPENLETVTGLMSEGIPVMDIAQMLLMTGFQKGKMNPDMMLMQLEPTAYMLLAIAEKAGINPVLTRDEELEADDVEEEEQDEVLREAQNVQNTIGDRGRFQDAKLAKISPTSVGPDIQKQIDTLDTSKLKASLLQKREDNKSLLAKKEV
jgi:hypothetical protein|tara:strand:- start:3712 stop:4329 length:618 start_codon:yes stop_codon:yes gene_type:complete